MGMGCGAILAYWTGRAALGFTGRGGLEREAFDRPGRPASIPPNCGTNDTAQLGLVIFPLEITTTCGFLSLTETNGRR